MLHSGFIEAGRKMAEGVLFMGEPLDKMTREELLAVAATMAKAYCNGAEKKRKLDMELDRLETWLENFKRRT